MTDESNIISELSIVVVDDNRNFLKLVRSILRNFGIKDCTVFDDAAMALSYLEIHAVDCVITDLVMPKMNGFELAHKIRHSTEIANRLLPIIMVTGHANRENVSKAVNSGIDEILVKPFRPTDLHKRLTAIALSPKRAIKTPPSRTVREIGADGSETASGRKSVDGTIVRRSSAKAAPQTSGYFDKKIEREAPKAAEPSAPQRKRLNVSQSDVFTVKRDDTKAEAPRPAEDEPAEVETWEV